MWTHGFSAWYVAAMNPPIDVEATKPGAAIVTVTPNLAQEWLDRSPGNRDIRPWKVAAYARDMAAGKWRLGEPIQFNKKGQLTNGHHRLNATIEAGVPIDFWVMVGLDEDIAQFVDTGLARTGGDMFKMMGYKQHTMCGQVATLAQNVENGAVRRLNLYTQGGGNQRFTHAEDKEWAENNQDLEDAAVRFTPVARRLKGISATGFVYAMMMLRRLEPEPADEFATALADLKTGGPGDPRYALLRYLEERRTLLGRKGADVDRLTGMRPAEAMAITFRAYNAWRNQQRLTQSQLTPSNGQLIPYPVSVSIPDEVVAA